MGAPEKLGLILTGGGARVAYQVGVLKAIAEFFPQCTRNPFPVICGTSSGSLNAAALAVHSPSLHRGVRYLLEVWTQSHANLVYRTDFVGVLKKSMQWILGLILSSIGINKLKKIALLDNTPMASLLKAALPYEKIQKNIDAGNLHALSITALAYGSGCSVTFYQGAKSVVPWTRAHRVGIPTRIAAEHLLASSAIPLIFPAVFIDHEYFGDGSMRQVAPISAALHLGATRLLIIGFGQGQTRQLSPADIVSYPSLAQIFGHVMDSIFLDGMAVDLERLQRVNRTIEMLAEDSRQKINMRHIDVLVIEPSRSIEEIAQRHVMSLPWTIRFLLRGMGVMRRSGANLASYLLFEKSFCCEMIELGYQDALKKRQEIYAFINQRDEASQGCSQ